jgi:putative transposase
MSEEHGLSVKRSCACVKLARSAYYESTVDWRERDTMVIEVINAIVQAHPRWGFWKVMDRIEMLGHDWNWKRVYRVYKAMGLNQPRRTKRRVPMRPAVTLTLPQGPNQTWSADFMSDALYHGPRFRTFNVIDDFNREALAIEIDTSLRNERLVRVFERLRDTRGLPDLLRVDNGPEFLSGCFVDWMKQNGVLIQYIQPGKPNQNAFIERFNRTYRNELLGMYLFGSLDEVRELTDEWMREYNEVRPHDALGGIPPAQYQPKIVGGSTFELSA